MIHLLSFIFCNVPDVVHCSRSSNPKNCNLFVKVRFGTDDFQEISSQKRLDSLFKCETIERLNTRDLN